MKPTEKVSNVINEQKQKLEQSAKEVTNPYSTSVIISNLEMRHTPTVIKSALKIFGDVTTIKFHNSTRATVEFSSSSSVTHLLSCSPINIDKKMIQVEINSNNSPSNNSYQKHERKDQGFKRGTTNRPMQYDGRGKSRNYWSLLNKKQANK